VIDTPAFVVDLDLVDANIERMQSHCDRAGLAFRPHVKTHKLPAIARMQVAAGAAGIACQKVGEAEVMLEAGLDDIMLSFPVIGDAKAARLGALATAGRISAVADSEQGVVGIAAAAAAAGAEIELLVECDTGFGRTGVQTPQEAAELAELAEGLDGVRFGGLMTYPTLPGTAAWIRAARAALAKRGLEAARVSGGGTPTAFAALEDGEVTELRAGTYVYGDRACIANGSVPLESCAAVVHATVVSRPAPGRAILDAGSKALTNDPVAGTELTGHGLIREHPEAVIHTLSEEHGHVDVSACDPAPAIGDVVTVVPNHACGAANLYDTVVVHRSGEGAETWPVAARGRLT
jgi:D-serine deaminase-like pyridoxal phosphate-dependent protein